MESPLYCMYMRRGGGRSDDFSLGPAQPKQCQQWSGFLLIAIHYTAVNKAESEMGRKGEAVWCLCSSLGFYFAAFGHTVRLRRSSVQFQEVTGAP